MQMPNKIMGKNGKRRASGLFTSRFLPLATAFFLIGCGADRPRSILDPASQAAGHIEGLWWQMLWVYGLVYAVTLVLLVLALMARRREGSPLGFGFVLLTGVAIPTLILVIMLIVTLDVTTKLHAGAEDLRVRVTSHHWWFEVEYPDHAIVDANEINVPAGSTVRFDLISAGVIHSFWVPRLGGKMDMLPDHHTVLHLQTDHPGIYHGTCTEYCAGQHALMGFRLVAHTPDDFKRWLAQAARPRPEPADPQLRRGMEVFLTGGCAACHAINGVAQGAVGPDLTLIGGRRTLGAGTIANTEGNLAGWIANPQAIKPRNMMPRSYLPPEDLHAVVDYLRSLK
jgi:cytochrome c oxidase subunit II